MNGVSRGPLVQNRFVLCAWSVRGDTKCLYSPRNVINAVVLINESKKECRSWIRARGESRLFLTCDCALKRVFAKIASEETYRLKSSFWGPERANQAVHTGQNTFLKESFWEFEPFIKTAIQRDSPTLFLFSRSYKIKTLLALITTIFIILVLDFTMVLHFIKLSYIVLYQKLHICDLISFRNVARSDAHPQITQLYTSLHTID